MLAWPKLIRGRRLAIANACSLWCQAPNGHRDAATSARHGSPPSGG